MDKCIVRKIYCGEGSIPKDTNDKKYSRKGSRHECLKRGYGAALKQELMKTLPVNSLQRIKYIGPVYEKNFKKNKISSTKTLITKFNSLSKSEKNNLLKKICSRSNGVIDYRAFNSVVMYLYDHGVKKLPGCVLVNE